MATVKVTVKGLEQAMKVLLTLDSKVVRPTLRKNMREGAKVFVNTAKYLVPVETGFLKKNLRVIAGKRKKGFIRLNCANFFKGPAYYGAFVEFGTSKMPARPFLRKAFDDRQADVQAKIRDGLIRALNALKR